MTGWNMPDGVNESDIPGNSPADHRAMNWAESDDGIEYGYELILDEPDYRCVCKEYILPRKESIMAHVSDCDELFGVLLDIGYDQYDEGHEY